jgi:hypothetical protein
MSSFDETGGKLDVSKQPNPNVKTSDESGKLIGEKGDSTMNDETKFHHVEDDGDGRDEHTVGYGKPPKATQFKKLESGNPKGRKPKSEYGKWKDPIYEVLFEEVTFPIKGKRVTLPSIVWMLMSMRNNAMKGCHRSFKMLVDSLGDRGLNGLWRYLEERTRERSEAEIKEFREWLDAGMPHPGAK